MSNNGVWNEIAGTEEIPSIVQESSEKPQLIYKHSHRCSVCILAKEELENVADTISDDVSLYMLNVINQREVSNAVASELDIRHESPQVILLQDGEVRWSGSHWEIKRQNILAELA